MREIKCGQAPKPVGPYSQAIEAKGLIFVSGQIPALGENEQKDMRKQTLSVLENIGSILEAAGSSLDKIVKLSVFLINLDSFEAVNSAFLEKFKPPYPARETVEVSALPKGAAIEISVVAEIRALERRT